MYHSITFGDKNTWDDWHLIPTSRPVFNPPTVKSKTLEVPGSDGLIDLSESLTGYPVYENRIGSFEFIVVNNSFEQVTEFTPWYSIYSDIMDYLHGQKMKAILEDDESYYYEGRFSVEAWDSSGNKDYSTITINYDVGPYKWLTLSSLEDWLWDPFNFETGVIMSSIFRNIAVTDEYSSVTFTNSDFGRAPICPTFVVSTESGEGMYIRVVNEKMGTDITQLVGDGTVQIPEFLFYGTSVTLYFCCYSGEGTVSIDFRQGRL